VAADRRPARPGRGESLRRLAQILRVDHAGELGAVYIYRGQRAVLSQGRTGETLARMEAQEQAHLRRFEELLSDHKVRPTLLSPLWRVAGFALGAGTALISESAAHACTEAVETVIEGHYAGQIAELEPREPALARELSGFRDEELAHRDEAIAEGAQEAPAHGVLTAAIRAGCRAAIRLSERI
jgi:ubiquinone biosynthesis monooxygenase Coq7